MGREPGRKQALIASAIAEIGDSGSLDVPVGRIAKRAGVSQALAFHYFGDKEQLFLAAMREILRVFGHDVARRLNRADGPRARIDAIFCASFAEPHFGRGVAAAWMTFYPLALRSTRARRLLGIYRRRLHSNLTHDLRPLMGAGAAGAAHRLAALIDGLYLRSALQPGAEAGAASLAHLRAALAAELKDSR